jgi:hypothetical protein
LNVLPVFACADCCVRGDHDGAHAVREYDDIRRFREQVSVAFV